jgi:hypothetical protein
MSKSTRRLCVEELEPRTLLSASSGLLHSPVLGQAVVSTLADPTSTDNLRGIEISPGIIFGNTRYGATCIGSATGDLPGAWSVAINYTPPHPGGDVTNNIVGGSWSLVVYRGGSLAGTLQGRVLRGTAAWNHDGTEADINAQLSITRGTGAFAGATGTGTFTGTLSHLTFPPTISGSLVLNY